MTPESEASVEAVQRRAGFEAGGPYNYVTSP